jgi:hypothetical protein
MDQTLETFRRQAASQLGELWSVEPVANGFIARIDLRGRSTEAKAEDEHGRVQEFATDDYVILVELAESGEFSVRGRRIAGRNSDVTVTGPASYQRYFTGAEYSGTHREWTFDRTPSGLVPAPGDPYNVAEREKELLALGQRLGLRTQQGTGRAVSPKLVLIIFGAILIVIAGVGAIVVTAVLSAFN